MAEFVLDVRDMPEGVSEHGFQLRPDWLSEQLADLEGIAAGDEAGAVALEATKQGKQVLLHGSVEASLSLTCVRCLRVFGSPARAQVNVIMRPGTPSAKKSGGDLGLDELNEEAYEGEKIILDDLVRDLLLLEVPMNPSCGEACPGWDSLTEQAGRE